MIALLPYPERDDVAAGFERLALRLRDRLVFADALRQFGRAQHRMLLFAYILVRALVDAVITAVN